jgi:hypothetical protein
MTDRRPVVKIIVESLLQDDEKPVVPTPLSEIRVRRRRSGKKGLKLKVNITYIMSMLTRTDCVIYQ